MSGMEMRAASMMAVMMLPGAVPSVLRCARAGDGVRAASFFVGSYLAVWIAVGVAVDALYQPHGSFVAGLVVIAAGVYELTPLKAYFRRLCRANVRSGFTFGLFCVGSSIGLMLMQVALGIMSVSSMAVITVIVSAQKLMPANAVVDVPLAFACVALGILIVIASSWVPGLMSPMSPM